MGCPGIRSGHRCQGIYSTERRGRTDSGLLSQMTRSITSPEEAAHLCPQTTDGGERLSVVAKSGETFEELLQQWNRWIRVLSNRMARRLDLERDDVYQDLAFALFKAFPRFNSGLGSFGNFANWVARGVFTRLLKQIRNSPRTVDGTFVDTEGLAASLVDVLGDPDAASPDDDAGRRELIQLVRREVRRLPFRCRESIRVHFGLDGRERVGRMDLEGLRCGIILLRNRIRIRPEKVT